MLSKYDELLCASTRKDSDLINALTSQGADIDSKNKLGEPVLVSLAKKNRPEAVRILLKAGANPDIRDQDGNTPLMIASGLGNLGVVRYLVDNGANLNLQNKFGNSALSRAAKNGYRQVAKFLIGKGAALNLLNNYNETALMIAIGNKNNGSANELLAAGADVHPINKNKDTALTLAAEKGSLNLIKLLKDKGADICHQNKYGHTPLMRTLATGNLRSANELLKAGKSKSENTQLLISAGMTKDDLTKSINLQNNQGATALMAAADRGQRKMVKKLINIGANSELKDNSKKTALTYALNGKNYWSVDLLVHSNKLANARKFLQSVNSSTVDSGTRILNQSGSSSHENLILLVGESVVLSLPNTPTTLSDLQRNQHS